MRKRNLHDEREPVALRRICWPVEVSTKYLACERNQAEVLAGLAPFSGCEPTTAVRSVPAMKNSHATHDAHLHLDKEQPVRCRERFIRADELDLADASDAPMPGLEQTQKRVFGTSLDKWTLCS